MIGTKTLVAAPRSTVGARPPSRLKLDHTSTGPHEHRHLYSRSYPSPPMSASPQRPDARRDDHHGLHPRRGDQPPSQELALTALHGRAGRDAVPARPPVGPSDTTQSPSTSGFICSSEQGDSSGPSHGLSYTTRAPLTASFPSGSLQEEPSNATSSKGTRRAKAHVASACVNCKKAHLACDADRPCRRCLGSGKQDSCLDVQHRKRGRPRLHDEREASYAAPGPAMFGPDGTARPPLDPSAPSAPSRGDPGPRHAQSALRVAPGSGGALNPGTRARHLHHPSLPEAQGTARPAPSARVDPTQSLAVAYLHPDLVFAKASASFCDALHARDLGLDGRSLQDVVQPSDWPKLDRLRRDLHFEREAHRSHRLPPISGRREDEAIMAVRDEDLAEVTSDFIERSDELAFLVDGHIIKCTVRLRLAQTSVYFVVMLLPVNTSRGQLGRGSLSPFPPPPYVGLATPGPPPLIFPAHPLPGRPVARGYSDPSPHSSRVPWRGRTAGLPWGDFHGRVESPAGPPGDPVPGEPYQSSPALSSAPSHRSGPSLPPSGVTTPRRLSVAYEAPGLALQWDVQLAPIRGPVPGSSEYPPRSRPPATEATAASPRKRSRVSVEEMLE